MRKRDTRGDTPTTDTDDGLKLEVVEHPFRFRKFANESALTGQIVEVINRMSGAGESAQDDYEECIARLCRNSNKVGEIVQEEYFNMPEDAYLDRWALLMLVVEVLDKKAVSFFSRILESEIPVEKSKNPHSFTTVGEEVMIRTTAIEGLERLAADGDQAAVAVLWKNIQHESFSIRRAATQALLATGGEEMRKRLKEELPKRHHDLLKIRRTPVHEAEQADGGLFLKRRDDDDLPAPNDSGSDKPAPNDIDTGESGCN